MYVQHQEGFTHPDLVFPHPTISLGDSFLNPKKGKLLLTYAQSLNTCMWGKGLSGKHREPDSFRLPKKEKKTKLKEIKLRCNRKGNTSHLLNLLSLLFKKQHSEPNLNQFFKPILFFYFFLPRNSCLLEDS